MPPSGWPADPKIIPCRQTSTVCLHDETLIWTWGPPGGGGVAAMVPKIVTPTGHVIVGTDMIDATLWLVGRPENHPVQTNKLVCLHGKPPIRA